MPYLYGADVYGSGLYGAADTPESSAITAWAFSIDGHRFIFINLGTQGTLVYDFSTQQWSTWARQGNVGIGSRIGESFYEYFLMGNPDGPEIYTFDPDTDDDDTGYFTLIATGGLPLRMRVNQECFGVYATGGRSDHDGREITLYTSDDAGKTWHSHKAVSIVGEDFEVAWRSLGTMRAPGRVFQITDTGVFDSIEGLDMIDA